MANREQVRRLKAGVEGWNAWRQENPEVQIDLRGAKLKGLSLQNVNLSGADIRSTNFSQSDLTGANFTRAKAGLQKRWSISLLLLVMVTALVSGGFISLNGHLLSLIFDKPITPGAYGVNPGSRAQIFSGGMGVIALTILYNSILRKGFNAFAFASVFAFTLGMSSLVVGPLFGPLTTSAGTTVLAVIAGAGASVVMLAVAVGIAGVIAGEVAIAMAVAVSLAVAVMGEFAKYVPGQTSFIGDIAFIGEVICTSIGTGLESRG